MAKVNIKKLDEKAVIPTYGSQFSAGADLYACIDGALTIDVGETVLVHTGIAMEIPVGYVGLVFARSGLASKKGLAPANKVGVIDSDYRGEIMVALHNQPEYNCTVLESILRLPRHFKSERAMRERAKELLAIFHLENERNNLACNLPYGKQRKLEIARALATNPKLLLLGEPAAGMNPAETEDLVKTIRFIRDEFDMTILLIEHDMKFVSGLCDKITVLNFGTVLAEGPTRETLDNPEVIRAYIGG